MNWTTDTEDINLYHIPGNENPADLLTKKFPVKIELVQAGSTWQNGADWMRKELDDMPITKYSDIAVFKDQADEVAKECLSEPFLLVNIPKDELVLDKATETAIELYREPESYQDECELESTQLAVHAAAESEQVFGIDVIYYGWRRARNLMRIALDWMDQLLHNSNKKSGRKCRECLTCEIPGVMFERRDEIYEKVENFWFRQETKLIKQQYKPSQLTKYQEVNGILYYTGRLGEEAELKKQVAMGFLPHGIPPTGFLPHGIPPTGFLPHGIPPARDSSHTGFLPRNSSCTGFLPHWIPPVQDSSHTRFLPYQIPPKQICIITFVFSVINLFFWILHMFNLKRKTDMDMENREIYR